MKQLWKSKEAPHSSSILQHIKIVPINGNREKIKKYIPNKIQVIETIIPARRLS